MRNSDGPHVAGELGFKAEDRAATIALASPSPGGYTMSTLPMSNAEQPIEHLDS